MSNDNDQVQVLGVRADGSAAVIGTAPTPPKMKARELVTEMFGHFTPDDGSDADLAMACCEQLLEYVGKTTFAITPTPALAAPQKQPQLVGWMTTGKTPGETFFTTDPADTKTHSKWGWQPVYVIATPGTTGAAA